MRLPASKTDLEGKGCFRKHVCVCRPVHEHNCADKCSPAVMFTRLQKCSCRRGRHPLCVFHSLLALVVRQRLQGSYDPERPLFGRGSCPPTQRQLTQLARACAFALQKESLSEWSSAMLEKWSQHCFRVAGAQLFARAGIHLAVIQVIGRWVPLPSCVTCRSQFLFRGACMAQHNGPSERHVRRPWMSLVTHKVREGRAPAPPPYLSPQAEQPRPTKGLQGSGAQPGSSKAVSHVSIVLGEPSRGDLQQELPEAAQHCSATQLPQPPGLAGA